jgi:uncharacterized protein YjdB
VLFVRVNISVFKGNAWYRTEHDGRRRNSGCQWSIADVASITEFLIRRGPHPAQIKEKPATTRRKYIMNALKRYSRTLICSVGFIAAALVAGCGGGDQGRDPILGLPAAELVSVVVTPATLAIEIGASQQFVATATYSDGSTRDVSASAAWTSATPAFATVNAATGLAKGVSAGSSVITAGFSGKNGSATLTVRPVTLVSLALTPQAPSLQVGAIRQLAVTATYSNGATADVTGTATYVSANTPFVMVGTSGVITGVAAGSSIVTATFSGMNATTTATVGSATLSTIAVTPATAFVAIGGTQQYIATATYSDGSSAIITSSVVWTSADNTIASVANTGVATGVAVGSANIIATSGLKSGSALLTVSAVVPLPVTPLNPVNLRTAASFGVLAGTSLTNNSGGTTLVTGDVGSPSQTTDPSQAAGFTNYKSGAILDGALADLQTAITDANGRTCDVNFAGGIDLGGLTLPPGVYCYAGAINITGTLTLSGPGVYIFRTTLTLDTTSNSIVALTNGATYDNVTWVPVGPTTLGANGVFKGSILGRAAAITVGDNTSLLNGRVLSGAAVTLRNNKITK